MPLPPLARFLDPRPAEVATASPIGESVNIPVHELAGRMHELPPRHGSIRLAGEAEWTDPAAAFLIASGRSVEIAAEWSSGDTGPGRLWSPNSFLTEVASQLTPGHAAELACGTGRDAVALAAMGWHVTAIDHLADALERGKDLAARYLSGEEAAQIEWRQAELESPVQGAFDLVSMFWFLNRGLIQNPPLREGGSLLVETFTSVHRERFGKPRTESYVLAPGELLRLAAGRQIRHHSEGWHSDRHSARLWAT